MNATLPAGEAALRFPAESLRRVPRAYALTVGCLPLLGRWRAFGAVNGGARERGASAAAGV